MNKYEFIVEILKATVWPLTIFTFFFLLRKELKALLNQLKSLRLKNAEFNFEKELKSIQLETNAIKNTEERTLTIQDFVSSQDKKINRLNELAKLSPRGAILETWIELEEKIIESGERNIIGCTAAPSSINEKSTHSQIMKDLHYRQLISDYYFSLYNGLRQIRNEAVHAKESELSKLVSVEFIRMAYELIYKLKNV